MENRGAANHLQATSATDYIRCRPASLLAACRRFTALDDRIQHQTALLSHVRSQNTLEYVRDSLPCARGRI